MNARTILNNFTKLILPTTIFLVPLVLNAQLISISRGDSIRISTPRYFPQPVIGTFAELKNDNMKFSTKEGIFSIPLPQITKIEVARGEKTNTKNGAMYGALSGGIGLGLVAAMGASGEQEGLITFTPSQAFVTGCIPGSLLGLVMGAIIGSGTKSTIWEEAALAHCLFAQDSVISDEIAPGEMPKPPPKNTFDQREPITRKWEFSFSLGTTSSGPATDIEKSMIDAKFNDTTSGGFFGGGPVSHPFSETGFGEIGFPWSIFTTYKFNNFLHCGCLISNAPIGMCSGYSSEPLAFLDLHYIVTTVSPMVIYNCFEIFKLGIGPGIFVNRMEQESVGEIIKSEKKIKLGAVFQAELVYPANTRFFVKIDGQYRYIGASSFGPFTAGYGDETIALPEFKAGYSHSFVGFGVGIRI